ncbi:MAG: CDP-diacylglycerol--serine O-phosphatidyltransferase [bacterium]
MIRKRSFFPSLFTMLNLFFGFFSIVNTVQGKFVTASWMIIIAGVWDAIDGKIARKTRTYSDFGIEFDSIADVVSFGAAPAILTYQVFFYKIGAPGVILSFFPLLFGAIRLARFNVSMDSFEKESYSGLPIPPMAVTLSSYVIFNYDLWEGLRFAPILAPLVIMLSILMVSNVEYETIPKLSFRENKRNSIHLSIMLLGLAVIILFREKAIFPLVFGFALSGPIRSFLHHDKEETEEEEIFDISIPD